MYGGMTAGAWQYIGSQGILQGTYETFMAAARTHFGGSLAGRLVLTAGLGGMGGAQPLAGVLAGAATLVVEVDPERVDRRLREGYLQHRSRRARRGARAGARREGARRGDLGRPRRQRRRRDGRAARARLTPDIVTDQTATDPIRGYVPRGMTTAECRRVARARPGRAHPPRRRHARRPHRLHARVPAARGRGLRVRQRAEGTRGDARRRGRLRDRRIHGALHPAALL